MGIDGTEIKKHRQKTEKKTLKNNGYPTRWMIISIIIGITLGYMLASILPAHRHNPTTNSKNC